MILNEYFHDILQNHVKFEDSASWGYKYCMKYKMQPFSIDDLQIAFPNGAPSLIHKKLFLFLRKPAV